MAKRGPNSAGASGKKRKRPAPPSAQEGGDREAAVESSGQEGDGEAAAEVESAQKKPLSGNVWGNLDLILSLQDKDVPTSRKIELAFNFISSSGRGGDSQERVPVPLSRVISFVSDWVQSLLISSDHDKKKSSTFSAACLDHRPWVVLTFCLEKSTISISQNILRPITRVLVHVLSIQESDNSAISEEDFAKFYGVFAQCLSLLFSSHGRTFNMAGVELWVSCAVAAADLVLKLLFCGRCSICSQDVLLRLSLLLLEQFASFLRFHSSPKNIFRSFVERLLEPLLELLGLLHLRASDKNHEHTGSLLSVVEDALSNGLFHPAHINGFLCSSPNTTTEFRESKNFNESYHRFFFQKFQKIIIEKKVVVMGGFGYLFHLFVTIVRKKRTPLKRINKLDKDVMAHENEIETNKALFQVFVQFMDPLILEYSRFIEMEFTKTEELWETKLTEAHCTLRTFNGILQSFMCEKIYERTQDSPEGAQCSFLKKVYGIVIAISRKMYLLWLSILNVHEAGSPKMLLLIAREIIC